VAELIDPTLPGIARAKFFEPNGHRVVSPNQKTRSTGDAAKARRILPSLSRTVDENAQFATVIFSTGMGRSALPRTCRQLAPHNLELIRCEKKERQIIRGKISFELPNAPTDVPVECHESSSSRGATAR